MVFIQFKKSQKNNFIIECPSDTLIQNVLKKIIEVNNLRIYLDRLIWSVQQLATKGVLRPQQLQGISYQQYQKNKPQFASLSEQKLSYATKPTAVPPLTFTPDKYFQRHGIIQSPQNTLILKTILTKSKQSIQPKKQPTQIKQILQAIQAIRQAVMEVFPGYIGLPEWEPTLLILEEMLDLEILESQQFQMYDQRATVWWAGKELDKNKLLGEYSGKNQKTKIIVKLQKFGGEQPPREPPIDAETYGKMVKFYYKKVQQNKQFQTKSVEHHYQKIQSQNMKEKLYLQDAVKFRPF